MNLTVSSIIGGVNEQNSIVNKNANPPPREQTFPGADIPRRGQNDRHV